MRFELSGTDTLNKLYASQKLSDHTLLFHEHSFKVHRNLLATQSSFFDQCFTFGYADQYEHEHDLSELPIDIEIFESFIKLFYGFPVTLTLSNVYHYYYCARYFGVPSLLESTLSLMKNNANLPEFMCPLLGQAQEWNDLQVFEAINGKQEDLDLKVAINNLFSKINKPMEPLNIKPDTFQLLAPSSRNNQCLTEWLALSLVKSASADEKRWTGAVVEEALGALDLEVVSLEIIYDSLLLPLYKPEDLEDLLDKFGGKVVLPLFRKNMERESNKREQEEGKLLEGNTQILFSQRKKSSNINVSDDQRTITRTTGSNGGIVGSEVLENGRIHRYQVSVDETGDYTAYIGAVCLSNFCPSDTTVGCGHWCGSDALLLNLNGSIGRWHKGDVFSVTVDLITNRITINNNRNFDVSADLASGEDWVPYFYIHGRWKLSLI
ncbi:hypothetical protein P9112_001801 [Eukaryota sp. TZLM1-RC]